MRAPGSTRQGRSGAAPTREKGRVEPIEARLPERALVVGVARQHEAEPDCERTEDGGRARTGDRDGRQQRRREKPCRVGDSHRGPHHALTGANSLVDVQEPAGALVASTIAPQSATCCAGEAPRAAQSKGPRHRGGGERREGDGDPRRRMDAGSLGAEEAPAQREARGGANVAAERVDGRGRGGERGERDQGRDDRHVRLGRGDAHGRRIQGEREAHDERPRGVEAEHAGEREDEARKDGGHDAVRSEDGDIGQKGQVAHDRPEDPPRTPARTGGPPRDRRRRP